MSLDAISKKKSDPRDALVLATRAGGVTLVLGAGVSIEAGVPNWRGLAIRVWKKVLKVPTKGRPVDDLDVKKVVKDPQLFPVVFELAEERLGTARFIEVLRDSMYETAAQVHAHAPASTLRALAEVITRDYLLGARRRIVRVVTFNADELLREALRVQGSAHALGQFFRTIEHAVFDFPAGRGEQPVPIYHVHGLLPRRGHFGADFSKHRLVFTDSQYWQSGTSQASLANRTMNAALTDSHCIFIGLSMTDANVLRWLALRYNEVTRDVGYQMPGYKKAGLKPAEISERELVRGRLGGHFWIRAPGDDRTGLLSAFLDLRGVDAVEISGWGDGSIAKLLAECFPHDE